MLQHWVKILGIVVSLWLVTGISVIAQITQTVSPKCEIQSGSYKNSRGDIALVGRIKTRNKPSNYTSLEIYLKGDLTTPAISDGFFIPNGYGTPAWDSHNYNLYFLVVDGYRVGVFNEGAVLWYATKRRLVRNDLWFQVGCGDFSIPNAQRATLPKIR